jgi:hypothetical protein
MIMKQWTYTGIPCPVLDFTTQFIREDEDQEGEESEPPSKEHEGSAVIEVD